MSLKAELGPQLPYLRRYARALTGSQTLGDAAVREVLEALITSPDEFVTGRPSRNELYRVFHRLWSGLETVTKGGSMVASLSLKTRQSLLLTAMEDFSISEAADILARPVAVVTADIETARQAIAECLHSRVLIIEDEAIIALHIRSIVDDLGHDVAGVAQTRAEAAALARSTRPDLVLADIRLADGSSGIDAVKDILDMMDVPVIFITAFPERLLTGERPEPTYLITKPFRPETVVATIGQALFFQRESIALAASTPARLSLDSASPDPRKHFTSPEDLLADDSLSDGEKQLLLAQWDSEIDGRLNAEAEGMSISDPISARQEGRLADESGRAKTALAEASERLRDGSA